MLEPDDAGLAFGGGGGGLPDPEPLDDGDFDEPDVEDAEADPALVPLADGDDDVEPLPGLAPLADGVEPVAPGLTDDTLAAADPTVGFVDAPVELPPALLPPAGGTDPLLPVGFVSLAPGALPFTSVAFRSIVA